LPFFDSLNYRAGIFDVRGTLIELDSRYRNVLFIRILRDFGKRTGNRYLSSFDVNDLEQLLRMKPAKRKEALERFGLDQETFDESWVSEEAMSIRLRYSHVLPDATALQVLKRKGVMLGVVTSAPKRAADVDVGIIKGKIGSRIFDEIVIPSYEPALPSKPDPAAVRACMDRMGVRPEETFGVGNSARDILAYKRAGILDILIERPGEAARLDPELGEGPTPSVKITSLQELIPLVVRRGRISRLLRWQTERPR